MIVPFVLQSDFLRLTCGFRFKIQYLFVYLFKVMSTTAAQVTICFYLLIQIDCWLHVVFLLIFIIYLFTSSKQCQQQQRKSPPVFIYLCKFVVDYMWFSFKYSLSICLLLQSDVNNSSASHHLFLFTYANLLLITCAFRFNINYLFIYLFKAMSTKTGGSDHLFLFTYANHLFRDRVFVLIFSIYLFIYSNWCQQKQVEATTCFYLLMEITCCETGFSF